MPINVPPAVGSTLHLQVRAAVSRLTAWPAVVLVTSIRLCAARACVLPLRLTLPRVCDPHRCRAQPRCCSWRPGSAAPWRQHSTPWGSARSARRALHMQPWGQTGTLVHTCKSGLIGAASAS